VSYVDAGYAVALGTLLLYAVSLVVRRRRWERVYESSRVPQVPERRAAADPGERS
jgi:hypothetical protein